MTDDQVRELAEVSANVRHVMKTVDALLQRIDNLLTRPEHEASIRMVNDRVKSIEDRLASHIDSVSARNKLARLREFMLTITVGAAALGVVVTLIKYLFGKGLL